MAKSEKLTNLSFTLEPLGTEICSKILSRTDVRVRLSFPTATTREHLRMEEGRQMMDLEVRGKDTKV
ncbi:hypothetical protein CXB51_034014 [Gossypium anomalum]|uniref:Uncharacterized protein n=1 Tax=Gossypium anomalum TaxID=47600 RepID=A0A8J5YNX7_9ROSI|nr:hypothetical protein CXB51_034014 [Gossypium anomalum]